MLLDAAIVAVLGWFVWRGYRRGLLRTLTGFLGFIAATVVALLGFRVLARPLEAFGLSTGVSNLVGAVVLFLGISVGARAAGNALTRILKWSKLGVLNSIGGGALAGGWAASWVTLVLLSLSVIPAPTAVASQMEASTIGKSIVEEAPRWALSVARTDLRSALRFFVPGPQTLVAATTDFRRLGSAERNLFDLINEERAIQRRAPLRWDESIARAGRLHAADMYRRGYFGHRSPEGDNPGQRMRAAGAVFSVAGENLALSPNVRTAHALLMGSKQHRRHILAERYERVGIGVMSGRQGLLIVQDFAG